MTDMPKAAKPEEIKQAEPGAEEVAQADAQAPDQAQATEAPQEETPEEQPAATSTRVEIPKNFAWFALTYHGPFRRLKIYPSSENQLNRIKVKYGPEKNSYVSHYQGETPEIGKIKAGEGLDGYRAMQMISSAQIRFGGLNIISAISPGDADMLAYAAAINPYLTLIHDIAGGRENPNAKNISSILWGKKAMKPVTLQVNGVAYQPSEEMQAEIAKQIEYFRGQLYQVAGEAGYNVAKAGPVKRAFKSMAAFMSRKKQAAPAKAPHEPVTETVTTNKPITKVVPSAINPFDADSHKRPGTLRSFGRAVSITCKSGYQATKTKLFSEDSFLTKMFAKVRSIFSWKRPKAGAAPASGPAASPA